MGICSHGDFQSDLRVERPLLLSLSVCNLLSTFLLGSSSLSKVGEGQEDGYNRKEAISHHFKGFEKPEEFLYCAFNPIMVLLKRMVKPIYKIP